MFEERFDRMPYARRPLCFLDIETTGIEPGHHEITELGFWHEKRGGWCIRIMPKYPDRFQPEARAISGYNDVDWAGAPRFEAVAAKAIEFMEDTILVGHNILGFDLPFIRAEYQSAGLASNQIPRVAVIDTQGLALTHLVPLGLKRLNLNSCCSFFDISNAGEHNAYDDALRTKAVYEKIMDGLRWTGGKPQQELF